MYLAHRRKAFRPTGPWTSNNDVLFATIPIANWPLDEESGNRIDNIGSYVAADNNSVGFTTGKYLNAAEFIAASSEFLSIATTEIDLAAVYDNAHTVVTWFKFPNANNLTLWSCILSGNDKYYVDTGSGGNKLRMVIKLAGTAKIIESSGTYDDDAWHLCIAVYNGTSVEVFVDNVSIGSQTVAITDFNKRTILGAYDDENGPPPTAFWDGDIDQHQTFDYAIDSAERGAIWNGGAGSFYIG